MLISQVLKFGFKNKNRNEDNSSDNNSNEVVTSISSHDRSSSEVPLNNEKNKNKLFNRKRASLPVKLEIIRVDNTECSNTGDNNNININNTNLKALWREQFTGEELASLLLTPREIERQEIINEIVYTEKDYISDLLILKVLYMDKLKESNIIDDEAYNHLFLNLNSIIKLHQNLFKELKQRKDQQQPIIKEVCDIFIKWTNELKIYSNYLANQTQANETYIKLVQSNKKFNLFIQQQSSLPQSKGQNLKSYLLKPFQRISKYPLLIKNLLQVSSSGTIDFLNGIRCKHAIEGLILKISEEKFQIEYKPTLKAWKENISNLVKFKLTDPRRKYLIDDKLILTTKNKVKNKIITNKIGYYFVLFNDLLVYLPEQYRFGLSKFQILSSYHSSVILCKVLDIHDIIKDDEEGEEKGNHS
ncbi:Dbl homology domain-containing protein [Neoconidiobolus thromboides FSU 785]|nr:Dbl homology domain-containing protein [Neoconidiobolus thromboides FSU 785]